MSDRNHNGRNYYTIIYKNRKIYLTGMLKKMIQYNITGNQVESPKNKNCESEQLTKDDKGVANSIIHDENNGKVIIMLWSQYSDRRDQ